MASPEPRSALNSLLHSRHSGAEGVKGVALAERRLAIVQVQSRKEQGLAAEIESAFNLALPGPGHASSTGDLMAVWIAPNAWLVMASHLSAGELTRRLASRRASITDQTFGKTVLRLSGARARNVLAKGCRVDLHPRVFGPGQSAVTPIANIGCVLVQIDDVPTFDLIVPSTLAEAFFEWLELSAAEFGCEVRGATV